MTDQVLRAVHEAMGKSGVMDYTEVGRRSGLQARTVREVGDQTSVGTLRKIAKGLGMELVINIDRSTGKEGGP